MEGEVEKGLFKRRDLASGFRTKTSDLRPSDSHGVKGNIRHTDAGRVVLHITRATVLARKYRNRTENTSPNVRSSLRFPPGCVMSRGSEVFPLRRFIVASAKRLQVSDANKQRGGELPTMALSDPHTALLIARRCTPTDYIAGEF